MQQQYQIWKQIRDCGEVLGFMPLLASVIIVIPVNIVTSLTQSYICIFLGKQ